MPRLDVDADKFADYVACFLLDKLSNMNDVIPGNEDFNDLCIILNNRGLRSVLLTYYMHMKPQHRVEYRLIKDVFRPKGRVNTAAIYIEKPVLKVDTPKERSLLRKVLDAGLSIITGKK